MEWTPADFSWEEGGSGDESVSLRRMPTQHRREVAEFVVDLVGVGDGLGDGLADGLTPCLAEAVELGAEGGVGATKILSDFLEGGLAGIG